MVFHGCWPANTQISLRKREKALYCSSLLDVDVRLQCIVMTVWYVILCRVLPAGTRWHRQVAAAVSSTGIGRAAFTPTWRHASRHRRQKLHVRQTLTLSATWPACACPRLCRVSDASMTRCRLQQCDITPVDNSKYTNTNSKYFCPSFASFNDPEAMDFR